MTAGARRQPPRKDPSGTRRSCRAFHDPNARSSPTVRTSSTAGFPRGGSRSRRAGAAVLRWSALVKEVAVSSRAVVSGRTAGRRLGGACGSGCDLPRRSGTLAAPPSDDIEAQLEALDPATRAAVVARLAKSAA